jgi:hypothetical protein
MTTYNVHIYREMRLVFKGIEADSHEAAAASVRDKQTDDYDGIADCDGDTFYACVDVQGDEDYQQSRWIDFEEERLRKAAPALLAACRLVAQRWERGDLAEAARACSAAVVEAEASAIAPVPPAATVPDKKPYSVLLLYPDYANDGGNETYYTFVEALDPGEAIVVAKRQALAAQDGVIFPPDDFTPLLVTEGRNYGQPISND